jgi:hypothetical protein
MPAKKKWRVRQSARPSAGALGDLAGVDDDLDRANTYYERAMARIAGSVKLKPRAVSCDPSVG